MRSLALAAAVFASACGGDDSSGQGPDGGSATGDGGGPPPQAVCDAPELSDVSAPDAVVGDGSPASCTAAALGSAVQAGGTIVFDCGADPHTIEVDEAIVISQPTVLDGGGTITLSGGGQSRILYLDSDYNTPTPRLVVQRLTFTAGQAPAGGDDTAQGGGAIYRDGGSLTVIDSRFIGNRAPSPGQDIAGGAIYGFGGGETVVVGSTFEDNQASNGGAIGSLNGDLIVLNSRLSNNAATGSGGNPGDGGAGGALYADGGDELTSLCGVIIEGNRAGAIGGGVFRVSNSDDGTFTMERTTVDDNATTPTDSGNAGGLYLQGLAITIAASTISRNQGFYGGGIWLNESQVDMVNVTIAENTTIGSNGAGVWLGNEPTGTLLNCTIADNHATGESVAGAIFGSGLTLSNTIIANNTATYTKTCNVTRTGGSGNLQWPDDSPCTEAPLVADPELASLADAGGDTEVMLPAAGSAAVGIATGCPATDQLGNPRPEPCTSGAVEPL